MEDQLFRNYTAALSGIKESLLAEATKARSEDRDDEAVFTQIKLNVLEVFAKMFNLCYQVVYHGKSMPNLTEYIKAHSQPENQLMACYMHFFSTIPEPWKVKATKDEEYGKFEELAKEKVKLEMATTLKQVFVKNYQSLYGSDQ